MSVNVFVLSSNFAISTPYTIFYGISPLWFMWMPDLFRYCIVSLFLHYMVRSRVFFFLFRCMCVCELAAVVNTHHITNANIIYLKKKKGPPGPIKKLKLNWRKRVNAKSKFCKKLIKKKIWGKFVRGIR